MKRPAATVTRASHALREALTRGPARSSNVDKIRLRDRAARSAGGDNQTSKQARGAAMDLSNSIEHRPLLALVVTGAIGFTIGLLHPRH
jgi:ElaB/YqjD/DUF883 family membrane-anchored ribosome-binding protein